MGNSKSLKLAKAKADKYFSLFIRLSHADDQGICRCVTCNTPHHWKNIDCGHFVTRNHEAVRYYVTNANPQCRHCNSFQAGRQYEHGKKIDEINGEGHADWLVQQGHMLSKRNKHDYEVIAEEYKNKIKDLSKIPS